MNATELVAAIRAEHSKPYCVVCPGEVADSGPCLPAVAADRIEKAMKTRVDAPARRAMLDALDGAQ